jgi:hypothetical protein
MKKNIGIAFIIFFVFLHSCKKPGGNVTNYPINAELRAAFNFQPGTYWIYKDSISGRVDSFFVTSNNLIRGYSSADNYSMDELTIFISEYSIYPAFKANIQTWQFLYETTMFNVLYPESKIYTAQVQYEPLINYPFQSALLDFGISPAYSDIGNVINVFNSYSINGLVFSNVGEVNHYANDIPQNFNPNSPTYNYDDVFYISSDVGIIKMKLNHPQDSINRVWEIQRWNIVK